MMYNKNAVVNNSPRPCDINHNIDNSNHNQRIVNSNNISYQSRISRNHSGVWQSGTDSDTFSSSEGNSWSSVSLSSSIKINNNISYQSRISRNH